MKCLALVGTPGVEMTTHYARLIVEEVRHRFGGPRKANLITLSLPSADFEAQNTHRGIRRTTPALSEVVHLLQSLGAQAVVLCSSALYAWSLDKMTFPILSISRAESFSPIFHGSREGC